MPHIDTAIEMVALGLVILSAHIGGKICRRLKLSEVSGQLIGGAMVGPYVLELIGVVGPNSAYAQALYAFHFFIFVFLGMVAFGIGEELHFSRLRKVGRAGFVICVTHALTTFILITGSFYVASRLGISGLRPMPLWETMLIASIGVASAPAVAFVLMNQLRVEGRLRHILGSVIVLSDLIGVLLFSILAQVGAREIAETASGTAGLHPGANHTDTGYMGPIAKELGMAVLIGIGIFMFLRLLVRSKAVSLEPHDHQESDEDEFLHRLLAEHPSPSAEILLVIMGAVSLGCGIAYFNHWPFLITAIVAGFMAANFHSHALFASLKIENITPVLNIGFFALIGAKISFAGFSGSGIILAALYISMRMIGKLLGIRLGCMLMGEDRKITACLPSLMLPQAGVAAVEAVYVSEMLGKPEISTIVLPAIVFFEVSGVLIIEQSLRRWRSWVADEEKILRAHPARKGPADAARLLLDHLTRNFIVLNESGPNKSAVIEHLVDVAREHSDQHIDRAQALQVLGEREQLSPTGFGNGIAIPHCRLMGIGKAVLVLARHADGVEFGGVDNSPCDLILLMLTSARDPGQHLKLISAAAHVLGNEQVRQNLRQARNEQEFLEVIRSLTNEKHNTG